MSPPSKLSSMIACPNCKVAYTIDSASLGARPRVLKCSGCGTKWRHSPDQVKPDASGQALLEDTIGSGAVAKGVPSEASRPPVREQADDDFEEVSDNLVEPIAEPSADVARSDPTAASSTGESPDAAVAIVGDKGNWARFSTTFAAHSSAVIATASAGVTLAVITLGLVFWRGPIIEVMPSLSGIYSAFGIQPEKVKSNLELRNVSSERARDGGVEVLTITGVLANNAADRAPVPEMYVALHGPSDERVHSAPVADAPQSLGAGETVAFKAVIANPDPQARSVRVGFGLPAER